MDELSSRREVSAHPRSNKRPACSLASPCSRADCRVHHAIMQAVGATCSRSRCSGDGSTSPSLPIHAHLHAHPAPHAHLHAHLNAHLHAHMHTHMHAHLHAHMCTLTCARSQSPTCRDRSPSECWRVSADLLCSAAVHMVCVLTCVSCAWCVWCVSYVWCVVCVLCVV
jgi:hypothetical protein